MLEVSHSFCFTTPVVPMSSVANADLLGMDPQAQNVTKSVSEDAAQNAGAPNVARAQDLGVSMGMAEKEVDAERRSWD